MLDHHPTARCTTGEHYEAEAPDTLDLAGRMGLAVNALTGVWDPAERWALGFVVDFSRRPAVLFPSHITDAYLNIPPKFLEALVVCRLASGNAEHLDVDREVLRTQLSLLGDDGLTYCPTETLSQFTEPRPFSEVWGEGRLLLALSMLAQVDDDPRWVEVGKRKIDRLLALTREKDGFRFLWKGRFRPGETVPLDADEPAKGIEGGSLADGNPVFSMIYSVGALGHGSGLFARVTGYEPALELSRGLARWALARMFMNDDGRYTFMHFHHGLYALMAVCEYGCAANDRAVLERVDACYRWAREMGDPLIGFYPEAMPGSDWYLGRPGNTVEICEVADMVWLALYLTRAGLGDYWDDVDRWVRNVYAEAQVCDTRFLDHIPEGYFATEPSQRSHQDTRDIPQRSVGSFLGWMRANDGLTVTKTEQGPKLSDHAIMHCCTANGARTLYCVWDSIVTRNGDEVRVNLLLNRASPWVDVDSYLPAEGRVVLRIKDASKVSVRIPEWGDPWEVRVSVGDQRRRVRVEGRWVRVARLKPGDQVTLTFPLPERVVHRVIGEIPYKLVLRGSNVVSIDPKGIALPLYEHQPTGKLMRTTRFMPQVRQVVW
ncbi:MAG: glycoside hydrolase family 127 protein [Candidatus Latescibacteria bacterium]|nr:glycoside hydrolase family 127 protein [Candidatus Latescibacterota bacterium]